jgi:hypothetical protein
LEAKTDQTVTVATIIRCGCNYRQPAAKWYEFAYTRRKNTYVHMRRRLILLNFPMDAHIMSNGRLICAVGGSLSMAEVNGAVSGTHGIQRRVAARNGKVRSAVSSGRQLFIDGDPRSAWSRRYHDLVVGHIADQGGRESLSEARMALIRRSAAMECELELMEANLSRGEPVDIDVFGRASGHLRRLFETLGLERRQRDVGGLTLAQIVGPYDDPPVYDDAPAATAVATEAS